MKKLKAEKKSQFPTSGKTGIVFPLTNLDGNLRTSNQQKIAFCQVEHMLCLCQLQGQGACEELESLATKGITSWDAQENFWYWDTQSVWGKELLRDKTLGTAFLPHFHGSRYTPFTFMFIAKHEAYENVYFSVKKPKKAAQPHHSLHPKLPTKTFR